MKAINNMPQSHIWIILLLILNLVVWWAVLFKEDGSITLEKLRAWWSENFATIMAFYNSDAYKKKQTESIPLILQQLNGDTAAPTAQNPEPTTANVNATANASIKDAVQKIKENAYIQWDKNARYTLLEYSDLECPFCKRHFQNGTVAALLAKYPTKINHIFRQFPLTSIHPYAEMAA